MRRAWLSLLSMVFAFLSCQDATQVKVVLRTNVPHAAGAELAVWASHSLAVKAPTVEAQTPWPADGEIGDVVVTPEGGRSDGPL